MKNMSFKILTTLLFGLLFSISLSIGYVTNAYSQAYVTEDITYDPGTQIYTYTYTLKNLGKQQVWWWGIFYPEDPEAILDDSSVNGNGFAPTDLTDCSTGWKSTAPPRRMGFYLYNGPTGEEGFYSTYASDFQSANQPMNPDAIDLTKFGGKWGWNGSGANIVTAYGIQKGQEGNYTIQSKEYFSGNKKFFYNTKDYWNSYYDEVTGRLVIGGFEFVYTTQRLFTIQTPLTQGYNLISMPVEDLIGSDLSTVSPYQASTILSTISGCQKVIGFDPTAQKTESILYWDGQIMGTDFTINPSEGFYAEVSADTSHDFVGLLAEGPKTLNLSLGYNFVSFIYGPNMPDDSSTGYTSSMLLDAIPGCKSVIRFNPFSQKTESYRYWAGYPMGKVFDIRVGEGYIIEVLNDISWTPATLSMARTRLRLGDEEPYDSLTSSPVISNIKESYQTAGSVTISWLTDIDSPGEVRYSTNSDFAQSLVAKDNRVGKVHLVELSGLQSGKTCYYEINSGATIDNNGGLYYAYTPLKPSSPLDNLFIGGRVLEEDQNPLSGVLVFVTINHQGVNSYPLSTLTDKNGFWILNLADLKNSSTGDSLPSSPDDPIFIEILDGNGCQTADSPWLSDLGEESGYTLEIPPCIVPPSLSPLVMDAVATPVLSPATGGFTSPLRVIISCATPGASIRYTTDGSEPVENLPAYASPVTLDLTKTTTVKAKGFMSDFDQSVTASGTYTYIPPIPETVATPPIPETVATTPPIPETIATPPIPETVATPTLSPAPGAFADSVRVEISCDTPGTTIYYTKDGSKPTTSSLAYTAPLTLGKTTTISAKGFKGGYTPSDTAIGIYAKMSKVDTPVISPVSGIFSNSMSISLSSGTEGAVIRYTIDGSEPTDSSPVYTVPLTLTVTATVKAKVFKSGCIPSDIASGTYTANVATPTLSPAPRTFSDPMTISISCATQGANICYTMDGSEPTENSPAYIAPVTLTVSANFKAKGFKSGCTPSDTTSGVYTRIRGKVATPILFPASGTFAQLTIVSMSCATQGVDIRYTIDGTEPTESSPAYIAPLTLTDKTNIKVKAFKGDWDTSDTAIGIYTKTMEKVATPTLSPAPGSFTSSTSVTISCATQGVSIRYTTDGIEPNEKSMAYTAPVKVTKTTTLKTKGFMSGFTSSDTASGTYTITLPPTASVSNPVTWTPTWTPPLTITSPATAPFSNPITWAPTWTSYQPLSSSSPSIWVPSTTWPSLNWMDYQSSSNPHLGNYKTFSLGF